jgi:LysM repeat protein
VIAQINGISDPSQLRVGQVLKVPSGSSIPQPAPDPVSPQPSTTDTYTNYVVKAGDTLGKLATTFLGSDKSWRLIGVLNNITSPNQLTVGQTIRIPPRQVMVPTVINTLQGQRQPSQEVVSFSVDQDLVYADRLSGQQRERIGRFYEKGLYRGGDKSPSAFITSAASQLRTLQLSDSEIRVITTVAENEGSLDAINTWDNSFLSFGIFQWTAGAENSSGELGALLNLLKDKAPTVFQHYFGQFGLDVAPESATTGWLTLNGQRLTSTTQKSVLRQPIWAYRFAIAGADTMVQSVQILHAINRLDRFYFSPQQSLQNVALSRLFTSELGVALLLDNHVNRPGYVVSCVAAALQQVGTTATKLASGGEADEKRVIDRYLIIRQTYGQYPMTDARERGDRARNRVTQGRLSDRRNSFLSNRQLRNG